MTIDRRENALRLLVVDDERSILRLVRRSLVDRCEVLMAGDMDEALEIAADGVDCVITDLHMPGGGGLDLLDNLRQRGCRVPLTVMSGAADTEVQARLLSQGIGFLQKPFSIGDLRDWFEAVASAS